MERADATTGRRPAAFHLPPGAGVSVGNPVGATTTVKLRGSETGGTLGACEGSAAPGEGPPFHFHTGYDEIWYSLEGAFRFRLEDDVWPGAPGSFVFIPRGVRHTWQNIGEGLGRFFFVVAPAGFELFFERFAQAPRDAPWLATFQSVGREFGMEVVGPPLAESHPR
jgi:quercetin dioxygenase-like cupin family protein